MKKLTKYLETTEGKFIGGLVLVIVLIFAYYFYAVSKSGVSTTQEVVITETDHVRGAPNGVVTLVEFGDFQCPACGAYEPIVRQVTAHNPQILKVVFRHFPLTQMHQNALLAARSSEAAGLQGKFWEMHDMLYDKQTDWSGSLNARDTFVGYASALGLNVAKFTSDLNSKEVEEKILAEYKEGVNLGVNSTPTFFVNGKKIQNPKSIEDFDKVIQEASK